MAFNNKLQSCLSMIALSAVFLLAGCKKVLDEKPDQKMVIPQSVEDLQGVLDDYLLINNRHPVASEISADNYYLTDALYAAMTDFDRRKYTWDNEKQFPTGIGANEWSFAYENVYKANVVLLNIAEITATPANQSQWNTVKGHAHFLRAEAFLEVAGIWAQAYDQTTASADPGVPLRLDPDFNVPSTRASIQQTYDQIITDLIQAASLLPVDPLHMSRPSKPAAYGLLARTYLFMRNYDSSLYYADLALNIKNTLKDYNTVDASSFFPFGPEYSNTEEIIYESRGIGSMPLAYPIAKMDTSLVASYGDGDLRKVLFFQDNGDNTFAYRGSYSAAAIFTGVATDEMYLIRAESYARKNRIAEAMTDLNKLLENRFVADNFSPFSATDQEQALDLILRERRKELLMRGLRWPDIKRLNKEGTEIVLKRVVNGETFTLQPNNSAYALAIPEDVIELSGMPQNPQ